MTGPPIELADWLDALGFGPDECVQAGEKLPGGAFGAVVARRDMMRAEVPQDRDVWVGPNPVEAMQRGRANDDQVTRLAALHIDIDVAPHKCPSFEVALSIVDELSGMLGARPVALTYSGHGVQPVWAIEDGQIVGGHEHHGPSCGLVPATGRWVGCPLVESSARALLRRWGRLVASVAERHGARVDALWDLTRILRCPGSVNHKNPLEPIPVMAFGDTGAPLSVERIVEALDEWGVEEMPEDTRGLGEVVAPPADWGYAAQTCGYAATMAREWATDNPEARHPWLVQQAVRIAAAHRYGCLDEAGRQLVTAQLVERFHALLARDARKATPGEISGSIAWGIEAAACMSDAHLASELGHHTHAAPLPAPPERSERNDHVALQPPAGQPLPSNGAGDVADPPGAVPNADVQVVPPADSELVPANSGGPVAEPSAWDQLVEQRVRDHLLRDEAKRVYQERIAPPAADLDAEYLDACDLESLPTPEPLIDGVLTRHAYAVLRGRDGVFKSFVALDWALCIATGKRWQDRATEQARVLYIAGEGAYGIDARIKAWRTGFRAGRPLDRGMFTLRKSAVSLFPGGAALEHLLKVTERGEYGLVVVDTLRRASGGADGNGSDMGVVVDNIDEIKRATNNGSVLVIAHTDKSDLDARGYSGIEDDADIVWHAKRPEECEENALDLINAKMKDGPEGAIFKLQMTTTLDSLTIGNRNEDAAAPEGNDARFLIAMRDVFMTTGATASQLSEVTGMTMGQVLQARGRLELSGYVKIEKRGASDKIILVKFEGAPPAPLRSRGGRGAGSPLEDQTRAWGA